ncbi:MAG: SgcJ/EcaC family oxidoreductase [Isosphaeraceae bacterium]
MTRTSIALLGAGLLIPIGWTASQAQQTPAKGAQSPPAPKTATPVAATKAAAPAPAPTPAQGATNRAADEAAIKDLLQQYGKAYNAGQADALTALMTEDVELVDGDGETIRGIKDVGAAFAAVFAEGAPATLRAQPEGMRFLGADVAQVSGLFQLGPEDSPLEAGRYSVLVARQQGKWKIAELRDYPSGVGDTSNNYEHLKDLEWMVGEWISEGGDSKVTSSIQWALNKNFLVREYSIAIAGEPPVTGVMYLGWDAQSKQVKSWVFDSEGGQGQAYWTPAGDDQWIIKAQGSLRDGSATSATQVITLVNKDAVKHSSLDRIIGGEVAADISEILMVRKPAGPGRD